RRSALQGIEQCRVELGDTWQAVLEDRRVAWEDTVSHAERGAVSTGERARRRPKLAALVAREHGGGQHGRRRRGQWRRDRTSRGGCRRRGRRRGRHLLREAERNG